MISNESRIRGGRALLAWAVVCCPLVVVPAGAITYSKVRVFTSGTAQIRELGVAGLAFDPIGFRADGFDAVLNEKELELLERMGWPHEVLVEDLVADYQRRHATPSTRQRALSSSDSYPAQGVGFGRMGGMYTLDEVVAVLDSMRHQFPHLISTKESIGYSVEGRPLWMVKISDHPEVDEDEPEVLYTALHHACEPLGMMAAVHVMGNLLKQYGANPEVTFLVDHRELYFVPVVNPDGYVYNQQTHPAGGGLWRKNRRENGDGTFGVDLNRNYGFEWGHDDVGSSSSPGSGGYRGPAPFSEPETRAIRDLCLAHAFRLAVNYHDTDYGKLLIFPWSYSEAAQTPDSTVYADLSAEMTRFTGHGHGPAGRTMYVANGTAEDWMYGRAAGKTLAWTLEIGGGYWPALDEILPLAQENVHASLVLARGAAVIDEPRTPLPPANATASSARAKPVVVLSWSDPRSDRGGGPLADFSIEILRDGVLLASLPAGVETYTDEALSAGQRVTYWLWARDAGGWLSTATHVAAVAGGAPDESVISTVAGGLERGTLLLNHPMGLCVDDAGHIYVADTGNHRVCKVEPTTGTMTVIAGNGQEGKAGDGGPATLAGLKRPMGLHVDALGNLFIADSGNHRVRRVDSATGTITTVAGSALADYSGDGGLATNARLHRPTDVHVDEAGNLLICDAGNYRVRRVDAKTGTITTVAGNGQSEPSGDGSPAASVALGWPWGIALDGSGSIYVAVHSGHRIRKVDTGTGTITTVAGDGRGGSAGDGGPATGAHLNYPTGIGVDRSGDLYIADTDNHRIRKVDRISGIISTVAGTGGRGFSGDGEPAVDARLHSPSAIAVDRTGDLYVADSGNDRIRKVAVQTTPTVVSESEGHAAPAGVALLANSPNPCNGATAIRYVLPARESVDLAIYNSVGQKVATLVHEASAEAGVHAVSWDGTDGRGAPMASGMYLYRLQAGQQSATRKLLLLR